MLSFVIPLKDERETLVELFRNIRAATEDLDQTFEIIFVDDGSADGSWPVIEALHAEHGDQVRAFRFRRNLGKAAALSAGFGAARGEVVFTLDADLQDDPKEIGRFLAKLKEGHDIVSGWKRVRHDPWHKVLPSRVFNWMLSRLTKTPLHDHNCGFKCYRAAVVKQVALYGEMHRMIPALGSIHGFKSAEIEVEHHPRRFGRSKYGLKRFLRGFFDMLTTYFLQNYRERPLHLIGGLAALAVALGAATVGSSLLVAPGSPAASILVAVGGCLVASSLPLIAVGFFAELLVATQARTDRSLPVIDVLPRRSGPGLELTSGGEPGDPKVLRNRRVAGA
jgi:dolichol-phosphate mannosyltransferase